MYTKRQGLTLLKKILFFFILLIPYHLSAWIDLEDESFLSDFIVEIKKLTIPGYPDAFNPSIIKWHGNSMLMSFRTGDYDLASESSEETFSFLMSFRYRNAIDSCTNEIGVVLLDQDFNLISAPQILYVPRKDPNLAFRQQDPRLIAVKDKIYIVYSNMIEGYKIPEIRRMFVAELHYDGRYFYVDQPECLSQFDGQNESRWQKNWVPFDYNGQLMLSYSINPHRVVTPLFGTGTCPTVDYTTAKFDWEWGVLRGGTQAILDDSHYLAFFHSSKEMHTTQSNGKKIQHYFMGAYTFSRDPPFQMEKISPRPIVGKNFYNGPLHQTWKPLRVVFPGGLIIGEKYVWVTYGRQDHETWIVKMDKKKLLDSMITVTPQ